MSDPASADRDACILVVDDTVENLQLLQDLLSANGYRVRAARSGELALRGAKRLAPLLVLLDINMPQMDGYEVCRRLKADPDTADIPVIFITAYSHAGDIVKGFEVGGADYVSKPFVTEELLARIKLHTQLRQAQLAMEAQNEELRLALERIDSLRGQMVTVCAWTHQIKRAGRWIPLEDFLQDDLRLQVSHGISVEGLAMFTDSGEEPGSG